MVSEPLTPDPADEQAHPAGDEPLWSESWYFDFADPQQNFRRVGAAGADAQREHDVDQRSAVRTGIADDRTVDFHGTGAIELNLEATDPCGLHRCRARDRSGYDDPAALLRGNRAGPSRRRWTWSRTTAGFRTVPDHTAIRDPVHGVRDRDRRRPRFRARRRARTARSLLGCARLVVDGLGVERSGSRRRHPCSRSISDTGAPPSASVTCNSQVSRSSNYRRSARERSPTTAYRCQPSSPSPAELDRDHRGPRACAGAADVTGRAYQPFSAAWVSVTTADGRTVSAGWNGTK